MLHLIYIPGLGDNDPKAQARAVKIWNNWGVEAEMITVKWADHQPWGPKLEMLLKRVDELLSEGKQVGLVGASAGASAAINVYAARKDHIQGVVCIAAKVNRPSTIGGSFAKKNPALLTSVQDSSKALANLEPKYLERILSRYGMVDEMVFKGDSHIKGATNKMYPTIGHVMNIGVQLLVGAPSFINFIKKQSF